MDFSPQQQAGLDSAKRWFDEKTIGGGGPLVYRVFGFAGTGKTTIAKEFAAMVTGRVIFASYTGKAAHVLREKGCTSAQTLHSLIYLPSSKSAERLRKLQKEYAKQAGEDAPERTLRRLRDAIERERESIKEPSFTINPDSDLKQASLLVIDEVSMVNSFMGIDLESFNVPILVLGDPAQLPPVKGGGYFTNQKPDVLLTEVHRQAKGSPVLHLATEVREGRGLRNAMEGMVVPKGRLGIEQLAKYDQVLVGTNKSRAAINNQMRVHLGFDDPLPIVGDRLICTQNDSETGLLNGSQWFVEYALPSEDHSRRIHLCLKGADSKERVRCDAHTHTFIGEETPFFEKREARCFDFAYAMTVHKSQGSQFDSVVLVDESRKFPEHQRKAWLYTGITRAAHDLIVIK